MSQEARKQTLPQVHSIGDAIPYCNRFVFSKEESATVCVWKLVARFPQKLHWDPGFLELERMIADSWIN